MIMGLITSTDCASLVGSFLLHFSLMKLTGDWHDFLIRIYVMKMCCPMRLWFTEDTIDNWSELKKHFFNFISHLWFKDREEKQIVMHLLIRQTIYQPSLLWWNIVDGIPSILAMMRQKASSPGSGIYDAQIVVLYWLYFWQ